MNLRNQATISNVHVYHSDFRFESRILRCTWSAVTAGNLDRADIIARHSPDQLEYERIDDQRAVYRLSTPFALSRLGKVGKVIALMLWQARVFLMLLRLRPSVISPHSVEVLPTCAIAAFILRAKVIYETHELESQKSGAGPMYQHLTDFAERIFCRHCSLIVTVCDPITDWYQARYPSNHVVTVRNFPLRSQGLDSPRAGLRAELGISEDRTLLIYQGAVGEGRGIRPILEAFSNDLALPMDLLVMGYGELVDNVLDLSRQDKRVHYMPAVPPTEVLGVTSQADIGLCLIEGVSLSYEYSLPNKLLEATMAGIPSIVSDLPEMQRFVTERNCGWVTTPDASAFVALLRKLTPEEICDKRNAAVRSSQTMDWQSEVAPVIAEYHKLRNSLNDA